MLYTHMLLRSGKHGVSRAAATFSSSTTTSPFGGDELPPQLGQTCFEQTQVVSSGLVLLRPGHLKQHQHAVVVVVLHEKFMTSENSKVMS